MIQRTEPRRYGGVRIARREGTGAGPGEEGKRARVVVVVAASDDDGWAKARLDWLRPWAVWGGGGGDGRVKRRGGYNISVCDVVNSLG